MAWLVILLEVLITPSQTMVQGFAFSTIWRSLLDSCSIKTAFDEGGREFWTQMDALVDMLDGVVAEEVNGA